MNSNERHVEMTDSEAVSGFRKLSTHRTGRLQRKGRIASTRKRRRKVRMQRTSFRVRRLVPRPWFLPASAASVIRVRKAEAPGQIPVYVCVHGSPTCISSTSSTPLATSKRIVLAQDDCHSERFHCSAYSSTPPAQWAGSRVAYVWLLFFAIVCMDG